MCSSDSMDAFDWLNGCVWLTQWMCTTDSIDVFDWLNGCVWLTQWVCLTDSTGVFDWLDGCPTEITHVHPRQCMCSAEITHAFLCRPLACWHVCCVSHRVSGRGKWKGEMKGWSNINRCYWETVRFHNYYTSHITQHHSNDIWQMISVHAYERTGPEILPGSVHIWTFEIQGYSRLFKAIWKINSRLF